MNRWLWRSIYRTVHTPSATAVCNSVLDSFEAGFPTAMDEQERRGSPYLYNHTDATFSHIMVVNAYDFGTDGVFFADPGQTPWGGSQRIFWSPSLMAFTQTCLQQEITGGGRQHIGIHTL